MRIMKFRQFVADHIFVMKDSYQVFFVTINLFRQYIQFYILKFLDTQKADVHVNKSI